MKRRHDSIEGRLKDLSILIDEDRSVLDAREHRGRKPSEQTARVLAPSDHLADDVRCVTCPGIKFWRQDEEAGIGSFRA